jgi:hypothetical protein
MAVIKTNLKDFLALELVIDSVFTVRYLIISMSLFSVAMIIGVFALLTGSDLAKLMSTTISSAVTVAFMLKASKFRTLLTASKDQTGKVIVTDSLGNVIDIKK